MEYNPKLMHNYLERKAKMKYKFEEIDCKISAN